MNVGFISTRLAGTDGVSLETAKLATIIRRLGHRVFYCAGELDADAPPGLLIPEMHFAHREAKQIHDEAFSGSAPADLRPRIESMAARLYTAIHRFVEQYQIDVLVLQNALAIPMHIPLGGALSDYIAEMGVPAIAHHHDFYWERERFNLCAVHDVLERVFPPDLPNIRHLVINTPARDELQRRKNIAAQWLPNIFDFATPPPEPDEFAADLSRAMGFLPGDRVILQPTRVIPRKGIELSIELVRRLGNPRLRLLITHHAGDEGVEYLHHLKGLAERAMVDLRYMAHRFAPSRRTGTNGTKTYSLWDAYPLADFVTYPSFVEGFGNAFLEAIYFRRPLLVNRYPVYVADLAPLGFRCVEIDGAITDSTVKEVRRLLADADLAREVAEHNAQIAAAYFSYEAVTPLIANLLDELAPRKGQP